MRFFAIFKVIATYRLDKLLSLPWWLFPVKLIILLTPYHYSNKARLKRGEKIVNSLEDLGVIFIKFGQILSTRRDLLPDDIGKALSRLQDNCKPFNNKDARAIIEQELGDYIDNIFDDFSVNPIAAASIAQVYTAKLKTAKKVIVKVVRPDIQQEIARDLKLLYLLAKLANSHKVLKRLQPISVVREFEMVIVNEPNMLYESSNAILLRNNFKNSDLLYVPKVYTQLTTRKVMVMERIYGIPISDIASLKKHNINLKKLAENGVKIFFTQVFKHNFFHADMHPGNIIVAKNGTYNGVDFGIMGSLSNNDRITLSKLFQAFFNQDYKKIAKLFMISNWVAKDTNIIDLENSFRAICAPMFAKNLGEISFGEVLMNLFAEARRFDSYIQPQMLMLDKTLLSVEGLGRSLYPELNLWQTAKPLLDQIIEEEFSLQNKVKYIKAELPKIIEQVKSINKNLANIVEHNAKNDLLNQEINKKLKKYKFLQGLLVVVLIVVIIR